METKASVITVRHTDPHEAICAELIAELSAELGALYNTDGSGAFKPDDVTVPRATFVVAWLDGAAVGCGALRPMKDEAIGEIKRMYVRPSVRGKGVSRYILTALEAFGRSAGYQALCLETGVYQREAVGLYESSGYAPMDCYGQYSTDPISLCYQKRLD
ncbi:MAG: GNAT family N-acetyltransferase [bacterium]|nr:GNAT family N-acetyltransferase [bacterium]